MLLTIERARYVLSKFWVLVAACNAMLFAVFLFPMFNGVIPTDTLLVVMGIAAIIGLFVGIYLMYRSTFNSTYGLGVFLYATTLFEFMLGGGAAVLAVQIADRPDLRGLAVFTNVICILIPLLGGIYREAKALGWRPGSTVHGWQKQIEKYIDRSNHQVRPALTTADFDSSTMTASLAMVAAGAVNIPLLLELFGGERFSAVYFAAPLIMGTVAYINVTNLGPGIARLFMLRKLEKTAGRRFINADLEQIQELRRSFFLSRWLMKDYVAVQPGGAASVAAARRERHT
jgi:hypothetical protein